MPPLTRTNIAGFVEPPWRNGRSVSPLKKARKRKNVKLSPSFQPPVPRVAPILHSEFKEPEGVSFLAVLLATAVCGGIALFALLYIVTLPSHLFKTMPVPAPPPTPPTLAETFSNLLGGVAVEVDRVFRR